MLKKLDWVHPRMEELGMLDPTPAPESAGGN